MTRSTSFQRAVAVLSALGLALAAVLAVSTMGHGAAQAAPSSADQAQQPPTTLLFLSVTPRNGPITTAILFCDPPGGLHPNPRAACTDLAVAGGDFTKLPGDRELILCPDIYDPVVATAFGWWKERVTWFSRTYSNACELYGATGPVFPAPNSQPRPTTSTSSPMPTVTISIPGPTRTTGTGPRPTMTVPGPTVTRPVPTIPGPTVTIDPPDTTIPN
jgi:Subtilisin inhibitor-like